jgi:hypothetical protein
MVDVESLLIKSLVELTDMLEAFLELFNIEID